MSTYVELESNIISDLAKDGEEGVTAAVSNQIDLAIAHYEKEPWWFLETRAVITSTSSGEYNTFPSDYKALDSITIEINNHTYPLVERTYETLEDWFVKSSTFLGYPTDYAVYGNEFRLYPVPNGAYPMTLSYKQSLGAPSSTGSNAWTTDAEELIQGRVEWKLHSLRYHDLEAA